MKKKSFFGIAIALIFFLLLSCSIFDEERGNGFLCSFCDGYIGEYGSLEYEGQTYKTVEIGEQTWMAENLNYNASGSKCYDNRTTNCDIYGRLYDWATAMNLDAQCNSTACYQEVQSKHRGICPSGWYIPSDDDWATLINYAGGSSTAARFLKATSGWGGDGFDTYGFAALPGGGHWWSASEYYVSGASDYDIANYALCRNSAMSYCREYKSYFSSIRCLKNSSSSSIAVSSSSSHAISSSSSSIYNSSSSSVAVNSSSSSSSIGSYSGEYGQFEYGGQTYKTVVIGTQTWMAENLNYATSSGSACYDNSNANCATYGRLYNWAAAMNLSSSCNSITCSSQVASKHRGICPSGWHIPTSDEWTTLIDYVGVSSTASRHLKATSGWNDYLGTSGNGLDSYGFAALPGGQGYSGGGFDVVGSSGYWWSASEFSASNVYYRRMSYGNESVYDNHTNKSYLSSIRCLMN